MTAESWKHKEIKTDLANKLKFLDLSGPVS